ncbi:MAG: hypothetical protein QM733_10250 [Ilumatobacteraceae bacterium]
MRSGRPVHDVAGAADIGLPPARQPLLVVQDRDARAGATSILDE